MQGYRGEVGTPFERLTLLGDQREPNLFWLDHLSTNKKKGCVRVQTRNLSGKGKKQWDIHGAGGLRWIGARD
jgi:hypothetical protein